LSRRLVAPSRCAVLSRRRLGEGGSSLERRLGTRNPKQGSIAGIHSSNVPIAKTVVDLKMKNTLWIIPAAFLLSTSSCSKDNHRKHETCNCGYPMCQYEKENLDTVIIGHASESQIVMFGEIHDTVCSESPPPVADSRYVISLLPELKKIGYGYLALEVDADGREKCHSNDIVRFYRDYRNGKEIRETDFCYAKPGWIQLVKRAADLGYRIKFIDAPLGGRGGVSSRDAEMFKKVKSEILNQDEKAKIVVYVGAHHVIEKETYEGVYLHRGKVKPLGLLLDEYTKGKNFTVYMGHTHDTPAKCDLFISYFIWETYGKLNAQP
jgi:hypothetical protein